MKKNILAILIASSIGLYGCGNEGEVTGNPTIDPIIAKSLKANTKIIFDILSDDKKPVLPSFLVVDTFDGTLSTEGSIFTSEGKINTKYAKNIGDPQTALGKTDGWGMLEPITIDFHGKALNKETAKNGFVLIKSFNPTLESDTTRPAPLTYGEHYVVTTSDTKLIVSLLRPLDPSANYMFAVTDHLKDANNDAVGMSNSYAVLKSTSKPPSELLTKPQSIVQLTEKTIAATTGVSRDNIIFSTWFTTAPVGGTLYAAKAAIALSANAVNKTTQIAPSIVPGNAAAVWGNDVTTTGLFSFSSYSEDTTYTGAASGVTKYTGTVKLPYFLANNTDTNLKPYMATPWSSATPSLAKILNVIKRQDNSSNILLAQLTSPEIGITSEELNTLKTDPENKKVQMAVVQKLMNKKLYLDSAKKIQLDEERLITKYSPIPQLRSVADVPYNLYMPKAGICLDSDNIPVSIFTHGFGGNKDRADYYAQETLSTTCQALIAIDLPLHGKRWHEAPYNPQSQMLGYMNLAALPVARDNIRQSITDLVSLRASLGLLFGAKDKYGASNIKSIYGDQLIKLSLDTVHDSKGVGYVGVSLGGIVGIGYTATIDKPVIFDENTGKVDLLKETTLFGVSRAHFDVPGGGLAYFLFNSNTYGSIIETALKYKGYEPFKKENCIGWPDSACEALFFNKFAYAAQTVLDTVDPANLINQIKTPIYLSMAEGDTVIPNGPITNSIVKSMVAGTLPMVTNSNIPFNVVNGTVGVTSEKRNTTLYKQTKSFHAALIKEPVGIYAPYASAIADMQTNSITFLSKGEVTANTEYVHTQIPN